MKHMTKTLKPTHTKERTVIGRHNMDVFITLDTERRKIRRGNVENILSAMKKGIHFEAPIVVNQVDGKFRVIDGNHRVEAIRDYICLFPDALIELWVAKYKRLTRVEEREVYTLWNKGPAETATDHLHNYFATVPCGKEMLDKLPAAVYTTDTKMSLKLLMGSHINAKSQRIFEGGYGNSGEKTVADFQQITHMDVIIAMDFCDYMEEIFGTYFKQSPYYRSTPLTAFYRIWFDNREKIPRRTFISAFKNVFLNKWSEVNELAKSGGRSAACTFYEISIRRLNSYRKKVVFIGKARSIPTEFPQPEVSPQPTP